MLSCHRGYLEIRYIPVCLLNVYTSNAVPLYLPGSLYCSQRTSLVFAICKLVKGNTLLRNNPDVFKDQIIRLLQSCFNFKTHTVSVALSCLQVMWMLFVDYKTVVFCQTICTAYILSVRAPTAKPDANGNRALLIIMHAFQIINLLQTQ